jgi:hypothetical protein
LCGFEVIESIFDQRVGKFGDHIGGEFRPDRFEEEVALLIVEILVKFREVGVVDVISRSEECGSVFRIDRVLDLIDRVLLNIVLHERSLADGYWEVNAEMPKNPKWDGESCDRSRSLRISSFDFGIFGSDCGE